MPNPNLNLAAIGLDKSAAAAMPSAPIDVAAAGAQRTTLAGREHPARLAAAADGMHRHRPRC